MKNVTFFVTLLFSMILPFSFGCGEKDSSRKNSTPASPGPDQLLEKAAADKSAEQKSGSAGIDS
jgi:hypothetical protein